jgi:hypothetical protein
MANNEAKVFVFIFHLYLFFGEMSAWVVCIPVTESESFSNVQDWSFGTYLICTCDLVGACCFILFMVLSQNKKNFFDQVQIISFFCHEFCLWYYM